MSSKIYSNAEIKKLLSYTSCFHSYYTYLSFPLVYFKKEILGKNFVFVFWMYCPFEFGSTILRKGSSL